MIRLPWLATTVLVAACTSSPTAHQLAEPGDVSVVVALSAKEVVSGDTVHIKVTVTNLTTRRLTYSTSACPIAIAFVDGTGHRASLNPPHCILLGVPHVLNPRDEHTVTFPFDGTAWRLGSALSGYEQVELSPGSYEVVASIYDSGLRSEPEPLEIASGP